MFFNLAIAGQSRTSAIRDEAARLAERQHCTLAESENILKSAPTQPPKKPVAAVYDRRISVPPGTASPPPLRKSMAPKLHAWSNANE